MQYCELTVDYLFRTFLYEVVATRQPANFGRVYAAYGGVFIMLAYLQEWKADGITPEKFDILGGVIALIGMGIIMFAPGG